MHVLCSLYVCSVVILVRVETADFGDLLAVWYVSGVPSQAGFVADVQMAGINQTINCRLSGRVWGEGKCAHATACG